MAQAKALMGVAADTLISELGACRRVEHDDVAEAWVGVQPVDEYPLADRQSWDHRAAGNLVRLDQDRLDQQGERDRDANRRQQLDPGADAVGARLLVLRDLRLNVVGALRLNVVGALQLNVGDLVLVTVRGRVHHQLCTAHAGGAEA